MCVCKPPVYNLWVSFTLCLFIAEELKWPKIVPKILGSFSSHFLNKKILRRVQWIRLSG